MAHEKWQTQQINAAVARGINPIDAAKAAKAFLALLPPGADPDTYIVPSQQLEQDNSEQGLLDDAVSSFVAHENVPPRFKLILLAGEANA